MLTNEASLFSVLFVTSQTVSYYWRFPCPSDCDQYSVVQPQAPSDEESPLGSVNHELPEKIKQSENGAADVQINAFLDGILKKIEQSENGAADVQINAFRNLIEILCKTI